MGSESSCLSLPLITEVSDETSFTSREVREFYHQFRKLCSRRSNHSHSHLNKDTVRKLYEESFHGISTFEFAFHVFRTVDTEKRGHIDFNAFLKGLDVHLRGTFADKAHWCFRLFDIYNDGIVTKDGVMDIIESLYNLNSDLLPEEIDLTPETYQELLLKETKSEKTGLVHLKDFMAACESCRPLQILMETLSKAILTPYYLYHHHHHHHPHHHPHHHNHHRLTHLRQQHPHQHQRHSVCLGGSPPIVYGLRQRAATLSDISQSTLYQSAEPPPLHLLIRRRKSAHPNMLGTTPPKR